jgi:hypothetical protein
MAIEIGVAAESVVCSLLLNNGFAEAFKPSKMVPFDICADGRRIEVKASTIRPNGGWSFMFQHYPGNNPVPLSAVVLCLQNPAFAPGKWGFLVISPELIVKRAITISPKDLHRWHAHINNWAYIKTQPKIGYSDEWVDLYRNPNSPDWARATWDHINSKNFTSQQAEAILRKYASL